MLSFRNVFIESERIFYGLLRIEIARLSIHRERCNAQEMDGRLLLEFKFHSGVGIDVNTFIRRQVQDNFSRAAASHRRGCQPDLRSDMTVFLYAPFLDSEFGKNQKQNCYE